MRETPVLIVGAGPTGLALALELTLYGIPHTIIESNTERSPFSRALSLQSRSLEFLSRHEGITEELVSLGRMNMGVQLYVNKRFAFESGKDDFAMPDSRFQTPLLVSQEETERVLENYLNTKGVKIERGLKAEKIEKDEEGVTVTVKNPEESEQQIRCKYLVGCDGSHSVVRKSTKLTFTGSTYPQDFILADIKLTWSLKNIITSFMGYGFLGFFPMKDDVWRVLCSRVGERDSDSEPKIEDFKKAIEQLVPEDANVVFADEAPRWMTRFRLHHRIVTDYREGRIFLAGDSAHIHSHAGGQGMNTGIQDSVNLAWKLSAVLKGKKPDSFLDSYNIERRRVGETVLTTTDRAFEFMTTTNSILIWLRNAFVPWMTPFMNFNEARRKNRFRFVSQLGIRYRHSPIVGQSVSWKNTKIQAGDRIPDAKLIGWSGEIWLQSLLRGTGYHLLLFSGLGAQAVGDNTLASVVVEVREVVKEIETHIILESTPPTEAAYNDELGVFHKHLGLTQASYLLIRPDLHVEHAGYVMDLDELTAWTSR